jgi:hypothetical protein
MSRKVSCRKKTLSAGSELIGERAAVRLYARTKHERTICNFTVLSAIFTVRKRKSTPMVLIKLSVKASSCSRVEERAQWHR